jgi:predicted Zn-dependent peptidase
MSYLTHRLPNGIRIIHKITKSLVAHGGLAINAGSRDEKQEEQGLAHFIEHMIFKGTTRRKAYQILSRMENVGGELNAYTTREDTFIYASFMYPFYERWFELLSDILTNASFPEKEIIKEKEVVLDELNSYKDSPGEQIFDDFDQMIYNGHPLGRNILGEPRTIRRFSRQQIHAFIHEHYVAGEMVICSVGHIPFHKLIRLAEKHLGHLPEASRVNTRSPFNHYQPRENLLKRRNHQSHCMIGNLAFSSDHRLKTSMILLNNLLGGPGLNSRLNLGVREKYGFCYNIESHYQPYSDSGIFCVYFGTDPAYTDRTIELIRKELRLLREKRLGSLQISRARQQMRGQLAISFESNLNDMLSIGKSLLLYDRVDSLEQMHQKVDAVTSSDLLEAANQVFDPAMQSMLTYKPR